MRGLCLGMVVACRNLFLNTNPPLGTLTLDSTTYINGTPSSGVISGAAQGSTITGTSLPAGFTIDSPSRTWSFDGTGAASTGTMALTETLGTNSNETDIAWTIASGVPVISVTPAITGTAKQGYTLSCDGGTWTNGPTSIAYQWQSGGVDISGATQSTYTQVSADIGNSITCNVTASNAAGSSSVATSNSLGPVVAATAPQNVSAPTISQGVMGLSVGSTLTSSGSSWTGDPTPTLTRQWNRNGTAIPGATGQTYQIVSADNGATITVTVTATNVAGSASATSAGVGPVTTSGTVIDTTIDAPVLTLTSSNTTYPPTMNIRMPPDAQVGVHSLEFEGSTSDAFGTTIFDDTLTISDTEAGSKSKLDTSLSAVTTGTHSFRARLLWTVSSTSYATVWSNVISHGSTTAPTITTSASQSVAEQQTIAIALTANVTIAKWEIVGGLDMAQFEIFNSKLRWFNNGTQSWTTSGNNFTGSGNTANQYHVTVKATDLFGNSSTLAMVVTLTQLDLTPDQFTFTDVSGASLSQQYTSNAITLSGMAAGYNVSATVSGDTTAKYQISTDNGTTWSTAAPAGTFSVQNGYQVRLILTSSAGYSTTSNATLNVNGVADTYSVTTQANAALASIVLGSSGTAASGTTFTLAAVPFSAGYRVVVVRAGATISSVKIGGVTASLASNAAGVFIYMKTTSDTAGSADVVVTTASSTWVSVFGVTATNLSSATVSDTTTRTSVNGGDPRVFADSLVVPSPGIGLVAGTCGSGPGSSITWNNGTQVGSDLYNSTGNIHLSIASFAAGTSLTPSFSVGVTSQAGGTGVSWNG